MNKLFGIYAITDNKLTPNKTILQKVELALKGGAKIVQFRDKINEDNKIIDIVKALQKLCTKYNATFVLNDRVELASALGVDGLHIGKNDKSLIKTRDRFNGIIGVSCYDDINLAKEAQQMGANYVAFGAMFASITKKNAILASINTVKLAKKSIDIPICLIGGIDHQNINKVLTTEPDMIAVVYDIFKDDNITNNTKKLQSKFAKSYKT